MRKIIPAFACFALACAVPALAGGPGGTAPARGPARVLALAPPTLAPV